MNTFPSLIAAIAICVTLTAQKNEAITYQGRLKSGGAPVQGAVDLRFALWDKPSGGTRLAGMMDFPGVAVVDGVFSVQLGFDPDLFQDGDMYLEVLVRTNPAQAYVLMTPRQQLSSAPFALKTRGISYDTASDEMILGRNNTYTGVGENQPESQLHVTHRSKDHVAKFENISRQRGASGILIQIHNNEVSTNSLNNFVTFQNGSGRVVGRIEGFDLQNKDWVVPPPIPDARLTGQLDPGQLPSLSVGRGRSPSITSFDPGAFPTVNMAGGAWPSLNIQSSGSFPTLSLTGGRLPSINFGRLFFDPGSLPTLASNGGAFPSWQLNGGSFPTAQLIGGSLPSIAFDPGAFPILNHSPGQLPSLRGFSIKLPTSGELRSLMCWAQEHGATAPLSMVASYGLIGQKAAVNIAMSAAMQCLDEGVVYGSHGADYAEWLPKQSRADKFQLGQIVGVKNGLVSHDTEGAEQLMVVSCKPIVLGNVPLDDDTDNYVKVAFMGQVPVVVRGTVKAGDYIVPSGLCDGTATSVSPQNLTVRHLDKVIGRAWSESDNDIYSLINVVVGVEGHEAAKVLAKQHDRLNVLTAENSELRDELDSVQQRLDVLETAMAAFLPAQQEVR